MNNIKISNFRKIQETWQLDLAPVTFFTGTNNSGKSTIFKALLILEDHIKSDNHFQLDFNGENAKKHKVDCYENAINRFNQTQKNRDLFFQYSNNDYVIEFHFQPSEEQTNGRGKLIELKLTRTDEAQLLILHKGGLDYQLKFDSSLIERRQEEIDSNDNFEGKILVRTIENLLNDDEKELGKLKRDILKRENEIVDIKSDLEGKSQLNPTNEATLIRLNKTLRELNISLDRAVEYLSSIGKEIEAKPTTKIDLLTYNLLKEKFAQDASEKIISKDRRLLHLEKDLKTKRKRVISLNQQIADSRKKLNIAIKKLKDNKAVEKSETTYMPEFSLEDFHPTERTIDRIIRRVLPKYLRENDKSLKLSGIGGGNPQAFRLGERINAALFFSVDHLSPHRNNQTRLYINSNSSSDINELIKVNSTRPINKQSKAGKFLKEWMVKFDIGDDYRMKSIDGVATKIEILENKNWINLVDKGFGAGQIFSILLKIALSIDDTRTNSKFRFSRKRQELIVIEEPEANLHPALQSKLADLFYSAYREFHIRFIVETHSEYALRKSQVFVKGLYENNIKKEEIPFAVYYFDKDKGPYKMNYREDGKFIDEFGTGFFDVSSNLAFEIL